MVIVRFSCCRKRCVCLQSHALNFLCTNCGGTGTAYIIDATVHEYFVGRPVWKLILPFNALNSQIWRKGCKKLLHQQKCVCDAARVFDVKSAMDIKSFKGRFKGSSRTLDMKKNWKR